MLCHAMPCHTITMPYHTILLLYHTIPNHPISILLPHYCHTIPHCTIQCHNILLLYYTILLLYYIILLLYHIISYLIILLPYNIISCYRTNKNTHGRQGNLRFLISPSDHLKNAAVVSRSCFQ